MLRSNQKSLLFSGSAAIPLIICLIVLFVAAKDFDIFGVRKGASMYGEQFIFGLMAYDLLFSDQAKALPPAVTENINTGEELYSWRFARFVATQGVSTKTYDLNASWSDQRNAQVREIHPQGISDGRTGLAHYGNCGVRGSVWTA